MVVYVCVCLRLCCVGLCLFVFGGVRLRMIVYDCVCVWLFVCLCVYLRMCVYDCVCMCMFAYACV